MIVVELGPSRVRATVDEGVWTTENADLLPLLVELAGPQPDDVFYPPAKDWELAQRAVEIFTGSVLTTRNEDPYPEDAETAF